MKEQANIAAHLKGEGEKERSRRTFLDYVLGAGAVLFSWTVFYPLFRFLIPPPSEEAKPSSVLAGTTDELEPNSGKIFRFGNKPGILIRTPEGELRAFTAVCTHLGCTVQYRKDYEHIWCACHNGHYDLLGRNIAGPPPRPLEPYVVNVRGNKVFVSKA
jgi:Rieske Fe-S protein